MKTSALPVYGKDSATSAVTWRPSLPGELPRLRVRSGARCGRGERTARRKAKVEEHQLSAVRQEARTVRPSRGAAPGDL